MLNVLTIHFVYIDYIAHSCRTELFVITLSSDIQMLIGYPLSLVLHVITYKYTCLNCITVIFIFL